MPRKATGLSAAFVEKAKAGPGLDKHGKNLKPNRWGDGGGLYLTVRGPEAKWWVFRYQMPGGKLREMGLGPAAGTGKVPLAEARKTRDKLLAKVRSGIDPIAERDAKAAETAKAVTFRQAAEQYIAAHAPSWRNETHAAQWPASLAAHVYPVIGALPVSAIDTTLVLKVLTPIWSTIPETASRIRARIESVLDFARTDDDDRRNPARWKGHLDKKLFAPRKLRPVKHFAALPYSEMPTFMADLRALPGIAARALEWTVLCASRTGETIGARLSEIDEAAAVWTLPPERMKARREHRVPLSDAAMTLLAALPRGSEYLFPSPIIADEPISNMAMLDVLKRLVRDGQTTVHGLRSTFRDWAGNETEFAREIAETALAHVVGDASEQAYRRGDALRKRRDLMEAWSRWCEGRSNVVELRAAR